MPNMINLWTGNINKLMLWSTEIKKAYLGTTVIYDKTSITKDLWFTYNTFNNTFWERWLRITNWTSNINLLSIEKDANSTCTRARIYNSSNTLLWTATFVWNIATFSWITITASSIFRIICDDSGISSYRWDYKTQSFPVVFTDFTISWGWQWNASSWNNDPWNAYIIKQITYKK